MPRNKHGGALVNLGLRAKVWMPFKKEKGKVKVLCNHDVPVPSEVAVAVSPA